MAYQLYYIYTNQTTSWLVHSLGIFGVMTNHKQIRTHKIHHGSNLGKPPPFPLQYILCLSMWATSKWHFVSRLPNGSLEISRIGTSTTLEPYNFVCQPLITMQYKAKLQPSSRTFQQYVARHLRARKLGGFLTFSGRESNCQFDFKPFFWR